MRCLRPALGFTRIHYERALRRILPEEFTATKKHPVAKWNASYGNLDMVEAK